MRFSIKLNDCKAWVKHDVSDVRATGGFLSPRSEHYSKLLTPLKHYMLELVT